MKKIQVNHKPYFLGVIIIAICVLWLISIPIIGNWGVELAMTAESPMKKDSIIKIAASLPFIILFIIWIVDVYIESRKTTVEYGAEKVHWKWLWINYTINFSDVDSVHYTIIHKRTRYGYNHHFEIIFHLKNGSTLGLNDSLESEDIDNVINVTSDNIKLMQLYRFIEKFYPEKCSGFVKDDDIY